MVRSAQAQGESASKLRLKDAGGYAGWRRGRERTPAAGAGVCQSGVFEASCSLLLILLYKGSSRPDRQARVDGEVLLCLSKVV